MDINVNHSCGASSNAVNTFGLEGLRILVGTLDFDSAYPTGGEALDLSAYFPGGIKEVVIPGKDGYEFDYDKTTGKVVVKQTALDQEDAAASAGTPAGTVALGTSVTPAGTINWFWTLGVTGHAGQVIDMDATPAGNKIYLKYTPFGAPYLCSNLAVAAASIWLTMYDNIAVLLVHDANAANGGLEVKFDASATAPRKVKINNTLNSADAFISTSDDNYKLIVTHDADCGTDPSLYYDDTGVGLVADLAVAGELGIAALTNTFTGSAIESLDLDFTGEALANHTHGDTIGATTAEVANGTNLSTLEGVVFVAYGNN